MKTFRPCPFCGANPSTVISESRGGNNYIFIQCNNCRAQRSAFLYPADPEKAENTLKRVTKIWNMRYED